MESTILEYNMDASIPDLDHVRQAMRKAVERALEMARSKQPPGDGSMNILFSEEIDGGQWNGGWTLQAVLFHDERMFKDGVYVLVDAETRSTPTLMLLGDRNQALRERPARMASKVIYSSQDRFALASARLVEMKTYRSELDASIVKLEDALAKGEV